MNPKLVELAEAEGYDDIVDLLEEATHDSVCPGICMTCDYTAFVESDCDTGWCANCETRTVKSALILAGLI